AAYFGSDRSLYAQRSAVPGLAKSTVPTMLVRAELDPPQFNDQFELLRDALCKAGRCPTTLTLKGHSHMSEVYSINTADTVLSDALRAFVNAR
ncbi:MAG TPA: hypothetical protein VEG33_00385, partial [Streptosporangiaceae bacterium]|nr:hypothetical protein [Streptosporangiaceae bacterium]